MYKYSVCVCGQYVHVQVQCACVWPVCTCTSTVCVCVASMYMYKYSVCVCVCVAKATKLSLQPQHYHIDFPFSTQSCIVVDEIFPEGNVGRDGRLCPGDQIMNVNGMDCTHVPLAQVNLALSVPNTITTITVFREIQDEGECGCGLLGVYDLFSGCVGVAYWVLDVECVCGLLGVIILSVAAGNTEITELQRTEGTPLGIQIRSFR